MRTSWISRNGAIGQCFHLSSCSLFASKFKGIHTLYTYTRSRHDTASNLLIMSKSSSYGRSSSLYLVLDTDVPRLAIPSKVSQNFTLPIRRSDSVNNGTMEDCMPSTATLQCIAGPDEENLRVWSPCGLFPEFSQLVQPLLHGASMTVEKHRALSCRLRDEIIQFLNQHQLIQNKNASIKRWQYCALGRSLATRYPNMAWEHARPGVKLHSTQKNAWSVFTKRLSASRKVQNRRMIKRLQHSSNSWATTAFLGR
ncbi:uncharacterized protein [Dermacentor albipictus]|uniref:uncharacterized protein isoform X3 n=1 Tax=Dermacentor albipictus TaxID=60249 RepID=UPI0038FC6880